MTGSWKCWNWTLMQVDGSIRIGLKHDGHNALCQLDSHLYRWISFVREKAVYFTWVCYLPMNWRLHQNSAKKLNRLETSDILWWCEKLKKRSKKKKGYHGHVVGCQLTINNVDQWQMVQKWYGHKCLLFVVQEDGKDTMMYFLIFWALTDHCSLMENILHINGS